MLMKRTAGGGEMAVLGMICKRINTSLRTRKVRSSKFESSLAGAAAGATVELLAKVAAAPEEATMSTETRTTTRVLLNEPFHPAG
jgi:hypothetical protein